MKAKPWEGGKIIMKEKFARWDTLFLQYLKRDWKKIIIWVLGLGMFSAGFVPAFKEIAKGQGEGYNETEKPEKYAKFHYI